MFIIYGYVSKTRKYACTVGPFDDRGLLDSSVDLLREMFEKGIRKDGDSLFLSVVGRPRENTPLIDFEKVPDLIRYGTA